MRSCAVVAVLLIAGACGGDAPEACRFDGDPGAAATSRAGWDCANARELALRGSAGLVLEQADLDRYLDTYCRAFEPLRATLPYAPQADHWWEPLTVETSVPEIATAWTQGAVATGVTALDQILAEAHIDAVHRAPNSNIYTLASSARAVVPPRVVAAVNGLAMPGGVASAEEFHFAEPGSEITIEGTVPSLETAVVFQIGWGDCFVDCDGQHFWRVVVRSGGATLASEWGDAIPADVLAQYRRDQPFPD